MGKKKRRNKSSEPETPFVSICTPTFNRRPFIPALIKCFLMQDYPMDKIEWLIYDDGTDKIEDLVSDIPNVKYFKSNTKLPLGSKRNFLHKKSTGDILVYMDDDDYYPPCRISHAVEKLKAHPKALVAGSSELYIYFKHIEKMYQFGPYHNNHATAGTFAIRRRYIASNKYVPDAALAEEKAFLKNYTVPFVQLDPLKTILVFSHEHNTYDKKKLLGESQNHYVKESNKTIEMFMDDVELRDFYTNQLPGMLEDYDPGKPEMKPDVLKQIVEIENKRKKAEEDAMIEQYSKPLIEMQQQDGSKKMLNTNEVIDILRMQQNKINELTRLLKQAKNELIDAKNNVNSDKQTESGVEELECSA